MINYNNFNTSSDCSQNVREAIKYCNEHGEDGIVFERGEYHFYPDMASESVMCVSNNDIYGFRRIAFLLSCMTDFCIDGTGSTFVFHGEIIPFYVNSSSRITLKNLTIDYEKDRVLGLSVTDAKENYFDARVFNQTEYKVSDSALYIGTGYGQSDILNSLMIRTVDEGDEYQKGIDEEFLCMNPSLTVEDVGEGCLRFYNSALKVKAGMKVLATGDNRPTCNIVVSKSSDVTLDSLTMYSSYSMGVLAQVSKNITVDKMTVKAHDKMLYSLSTDALHFVNCSGLVRVADSTFSNQLDDALNVHGIFTKITEKSDDCIIVKFMHKSAKGIDIYDAGDKISVLDPRSLVGNSCYTVKKAENVNLNYIKLYLDEATDSITVGDVVENVTKNCDLIFEGNSVFKNRARGLLIGTKGRVDIRDNYFHTSGTAILFESDGEYWFESGGTTDVRIYKNTFDSCCSGPEHWGTHVIKTSPRTESVEGMYYHRSMSITDNKFISSPSPVLYADNISELTFKNNFSDIAVEYEIGRCGKIDVSDTNERQK